MLALLLLLQGADGAGTYSGTAKQLDVHLPRIETPAKIAGVLDDAVWRQAAMLTHFSQYRPVDGRPPRIRPRCSCGTRPTRSTLASARSNSQAPWCAPSWPHGTTLTRTTNWP